MFVPIYQLNYDSKEAKALAERWRDNRNAYLHVIDLIKKGAGEDFLQQDYESGNLSFLESMWDLKGIGIHGLEIEFPIDDNFEAINFSYAEFFNSEFTNAHFQCGFRFARFYGSTFRNCTFLITNWLGCRFKECTFVNCDFIEESSMENCDFKDTKFINCFIDQVLFNDCRFDPNCIINDPIKLPNGGAKGVYSDHKYFSTFFNAISEAYKIGGIYDKARLYYYKARKARTKYSSKNKMEYFKSKLIELSTGYGVKPLRPLYFLLGFLLIFTGVYYIHFKDFNVAFLTSLSAIFTMGDSSILPSPFNIILIIEACLGIALLSLYITILANVWFSEKSN